MKKLRNFFFVIFFIMFLITDTFWQFIKKYRNQLLVVIFLTTFILWFLLACKQKQVIKHPAELNKKIDSLISIQNKKEKQLILELKSKQIEIDNLKKNYENEKKNYNDFIKKNNRFNPIILDDLQSDSIITKHLKESGY